MEPFASVNGTPPDDEPGPCYWSADVFATEPSVVCALVYSLLALLSVATACGNLLVIVAILYFKELHTPTNYLLVSLGVADLLVGLWVSPLSMAFTLSSCLRHLSLMCRIRDGFDASLCTSSILHLCCISIDRYYAVCRPLRYRAKMSLEVTLAMILLSWCIAAVLGIAIVIAGYSQGSCEEGCSVDVVLANVMGPVVSFFLPAFIMLSIYMKIFLVAQRQFKRLQGTQSGGAAPRAESKATKTLAVVMGTFLLCLTPYFAFVVFQPLSPGPPPLAAIEALNWLTLSNSLLNPFIYGFFYSCFRSAFAMIVTGKIFRGDFSASKLL